ncbi:hypothetical protein OEG84_25120 [Hoeflea sp. G2-23]|uniref:Mu-like prophage FluMu N-terminal domain-containing protein n=1 Tax=Hoeflea algicola TaxID=2983763 RepID=A0ABT3ZGE7_9HYPH|nr:hypothetical protein [Hoeflea algicola]MCY0150890.1 hypothetical protein [Hoeflea algicola]
MEHATGELMNPHKRIEGLHTVKGAVHFKPGQTRTVTLTEKQAERAIKLGFVAVRPADEPEDQPVTEPLDRDDLKKQAGELGLEYAKNIPTEKLKELIDAKLAD